MEAPAQSCAPDAGRVGRALTWLAQTFALIGGVMLFAMTLMSTVSILGRWLLAQSIPGDYEIAQLATAIAVSAFLPWCALRGGHVVVDFLTNNAPARIRHALDALGYFSIAFVGVLVAWRLAEGLIGLRDSGETTMVLSIPTWYAYAPMIPSFLLLGAVALYRTAEHARSAWANPQ